MHHVRRKIRAGHYAVAGTRKATHFAEIKRAFEWSLKERKLCKRIWVASILELEDAPMATIKLKAKWRTFRTLKEATSFAMKTLRELHKDIPAHLYRDLTRPAGAPLD